MKTMPNSVREELAALAKRTAPSDREIDVSDIPASSASDWRGAVRGKFYRPVKEQLTVRLDADVLAWLKSDGAGYQSRMNEILRRAMLGKLG